MHNNLPLPSKCAQSAPGNQPYSMVRKAMGNLYETYTCRSESVYAAGPANLIVMHYGWIADCVQSRCLVSSYAFVGGSTGEYVEWGNRRAA